MKESERILKIIEVLKATYPEAKCSLDYGNPFQLMIATILSAQCTDKRVNEVTPQVFKEFPDAEAMANAPLSRLEKLVESTGFFRQKAKSLKNSSAILARDYSGLPPRELESLVKLPGVGRKTANVILGNAYGKAEGVVVDTHVGRLSQRLGLSKHKDAVKIERDLNKKIPASFWIDLPHWLIHHGRQICTARKPKCLECPLLPLCSRRGLPRLKAPASGYRMNSRSELVPAKKLKSSRAFRAKTR